MLRQVSLFTALLCAPAFAAAAVCPFSWSRGLVVGSAGPDVLALQQFLNQSSETAVALTGAGSAGQETARFGSLTMLAVKKFQAKHDLPSVGNVGPRTIALLNGQCAAPTASATVATSSVSSAAAVLTVLPAQDQPIASLAPSNAGYVKFTRFILSAEGNDVHVTKFSVRRAGAGNNAAFYSIGLEDEDGNLIDKERGLNSNSQVSFAANIVIPKGEQKEFLIYGNMNDALSDYVGQTPMLWLDSVDADASVKGDLPMRGSIQTINDSIVIGAPSLVLSQYDPQSDRTSYPFETRVRFAGIRITADSKEDEAFDGITFRQGGTVSANDLENVALVIDGARYTPEVSGSEYGFDIDPAIAIPKGRSIDMYLEGDIRPSAGNRTVKFDIARPDDISVKGLSYGFYLSAWPEGNTAMSGNSVFLTSDGTTDGDAQMPFFSGALYTIVPSSLQIGR